MRENKTATNIKDDILLLQLALAFTYDTVVKKKHSGPMYPLSTTVQDAPIQSWKKSQKPHHAHPRLVFIHIAGALWIWLSRWKASGDQRTTREKKRKEVGCGHFAQNQWFALALLLQFCWVQNSTGGTEVDKKDSLARVCGQRRCRTWPNFQSSHQPELQHPDLNHFNDRGHHTVDV